MIRRSLCLLVCFALVALSGLAGCASSADRRAMTVAQAATGKKHPYSVSVRTSGGSETGAMDSSNIADQDLKAAIEDSITQTGLFQRVLQGKDADYELTVSVVQIDKPIFGLTFTVNLEASWVLVRASDRRVALRKSIRSTHTATVGDAFAAVTRLRLAVEGAARQNIEQGLREISQLAL